MKFLVALQSTRAVVTTVLMPYCRWMGKRIALLDLLATSTDTITKEEDIVMASCSKKTLHPFHWLLWLTEGGTITQRISFLFLPILLCISPSPTLQTWLWWLRY